MQWNGRRVTILGLGHFGGGVAAARWLARQGAVVTVTDLTDRATLAEPLAALDGVPIAAMHLGGHREEDFQNADLVVVNPAVRPDNRFLAVARDSGARLTSEIELFLAASPAPVIGVTGSNGKSTTASMTASILAADGRQVWLGGNIGGSLLADLDRIGPDDWVVLELSSFQLRHLEIGRLAGNALRADVPSAAKQARLAVVTNCRPNHLDWHGTYENYVAAKQRILVGQAPSDLAVLGRTLFGDDAWRRLVKGRLLPLWPEAKIPPLRVPGDHNRTNAACAATAAAAVGCSGDAIRRGLESFAGLPDRLEPLGTIDGRRFYNDSASTTPDSAIAALAALKGPIRLMAGGSDKGIDLAPLADAIVAKACGATFYGATAEVLRRHVAARAAGFPCSKHETLDEAFDWCWSQSRSGDCIVLSPGCASRDQFQNYRRRGDRFKRLVDALCAEHESVGGDSRRRLKRL
jgi:UDP-N-acetylmuramoylalanine--D-glutamate ligase